MTPFHARLDALAVQSVLLGQQFSPTLNQLVSAGYATKEFHSLDKAIYRITHKGLLAAWGKRMAA